MPFAGRTVASLTRSPPHLAAIPGRQPLGALDDDRPLLRPDPLHMNVFLWIVAGQLALVFLAAGAMKLLRTKEDLAENGMGWTVDFSIPVVKSIGALEILAALGLILPALFDIVPVLVPLPADGLVLLMVGAAAPRQTPGGPDDRGQLDPRFPCRGRGVGPPRPRLLQPMITKGGWTR